MTSQTKVLKALPNDLLAGYQKPEDLIDPNDLLKQLTKAHVGSAFQAEIAKHLIYYKHKAMTNGSCSALNVKSHKSLTDEFG